jgi:hypothetical protein
VDDRRLVSSGSGGEHRMVLGGIVWCMGGGRGVYVLY